MITTNQLSTLTIRDLEFLHTLYKTRSLTVASKEMCASVSKLSKQLNKLRDTLGDQLFVRSSRELLPTRRMTEIDTHIIRILSSVAVLGNEAAFTPADVRLQVRISATDNVLVSYCRPALRRLCAEAPGISFQILPIEGDIFHPLQNGNADFLIYPTDRFPDTCRHALLEPIRWVYLMRPGHPLLEKTGSGPVPLEAARQYDFIEITGGEAAAQANGFQIKILLPYITSAPLLLMQSDALIVYPEAAAKIWAQTAGLEWRPAVLEHSLELQPALIWHERTHADPLYQWIRSVLIQSARSGEA